VAERGRIGSRRVAEEEEVLVSKGRRSAPTAAERAHAHIRDGIIKGIYPPASMLSENELAADLEMSRTPVRTALTRLQDEGWITIYPQRGALVRHFTADELRESTEFLHALEFAGIQSADVSTRRRFADDLAANLEAQLAALKAGDFSGFSQLAIEFHRSFVVLGGNGLMLAAYDRLRDRQNLIIAKAGDRLAAEPDEVVQEHRAILEFARDGRWEELSTALYAHRAYSFQSDSTSPRSGDA
jgi:DNA-binding GntR family transcriptional regulator